MTHVFPWDGGGGTRFTLPFETTGGWGGVGDQTAERNKWDNKKQRSLKRQVNQ